MKKAYVTISSIVLTGFLLLTISACGKNDNDNAEKTTEITSDSVEEQTSYDITSEMTSEQDDLKNEEQQSSEKEIQKKSEEAQKKSEEELKKKAEQEERKKALEEKQKQAAEEAKKKSEEEMLKAEQMNSFSMMYYLAITAEKIRTSKDNRLYLEETYTSLLNDPNPGAIDEITQDHLKVLRDIIKSYINISTKRERLQYIYNQEKAASMRKAVPNPLAVLSMTNSLDWKKLSVAVVYTVVDSYSSYKSASENADKDFLMSGWDLDDEELAAVQKNRDRAFDYMVDMVQEYHLDGLKTLSEKDIEKYQEICTIESPREKIKRLTAEEGKYEFLGDYWLELVDCYFDSSQYEKCLYCVDRYNEVATNIYRQDYNYVRVLPKAIVAAQNTYSGNKYNDTISRFAEDIMANTSTEDWSTRYFVAQVYLDLYSRTKTKTYLEKAYDISYNNVTVLLKEQRALNSTYLKDVEEVVVAEPDYKYLTDEQKKEKEKEYKEEKKRAKEYNKQMLKQRKTELPTLYEPLVLNCELLFALADEMKIDESEKRDIDAILDYEADKTFISAPISDFYSFSHNDSDYEINISEDVIEMPVNLLTSESVISVVVEEGKDKTRFDDCVVSKIERKGSTIDTFVASVTSPTLKKYKWTANSKVTVTIKYGDAYDRSIDLKYKVKSYTHHWYGDKIAFGKR